MRCLFRMISGLLVLAVLIAAAVILLPRLLHTCDNCDEFFVGTGYSANIISDAVTAITGKEDKILCAECAKEEHALALLTGKTLDDFKRPLFGDK